MEATNSTQLSQEEEEEDESILVASVECPIVGIRFYNGVAHKGEYVVLVRESQNPYDRNAIRIDNMHGDKVGHIKATSAKKLSPIMDNAERFRVRIEGTIPRHGSAYSLPLLLEFYSMSPLPELTNKLAKLLQKNLRYEAMFNLSRESQSRVGGNSVSAAESQELPLTVVTKRLDWNKQQQALDKMFDKELEEQYKDLPNVNMPSCFKGITLFDYQIQGIKWLLKKEAGATAPFYKSVKEGGKQMYLCEITQSSQSQPPSPIKGSILCDEMGLGKTIQALGLILLSPPPGVEYKAQKKASSGSQEKKNMIPMPTESTIRSVNIATLKCILKAAKLKVSGKKQDLIQRILDGGNSGEVTGEHFPVSMKPTVGATNRCTLIVCPVSVMSNWQHQVDAHVEEGVLSMRMYHGSNRTEILPDIKAGAVDILLVSYHTLAAEYGTACTSNDGNGGNDAPKKKKSRKESIFDTDFHRIILDEAHTIRSSKTKFFKAVKEINADRKLAITGTPFVNRAEDVHSLLSFLGVEPLDNKTVFRRAITQQIKNGNEIGLTRLRTCMGFVSLRRSKQNVNVKMVDKNVQLCSIEFPDDAHKRVYDALFGTLRVAMEAILGEDGGSAALKNYSSVFEKLLRLRQTCCSGTLVAPERREIALKTWDELQGQSSDIKLSAEEGLALLEKLKGAFTEEPNSLPECGICLMEMEEADGTILKSCSHVFCKLCIQQVLARSNRKCPYCRSDFTEDDIVDMSVAESAAKFDGKEEAVNNNFGTPPKIQALLAAIKNMKPDEKGVIFSQFTKHLDLIQKEMEDAGHTYVRIDGSVPALKRIDCVHKFNSEATDSPRFILCSLLASGTGINLTRGNHAFMMDCWWNEAIENQAMDRIHRINQKRNVTIMRFVMKDSIEERIVALQEAKSMQAKGVLQKLKGDEKRKALLGDLRGLLQLEEV